MKPNGRVFIAGTGRSGTSPLLTILGSHPDVARIGDETRFIVDPGGMRELFDVLTTRYDFYKASDAFRRFDEMMRLQLTGSMDTIQRGFRLDRLFGASDYFAALHRFEAALTLLEFDEELSPESSIESEQAFYGPAQRKHNRRVVPRYFTDTDELVDLCRDFVDTLFGGYAEKQGKAWWCEKTPFNLLNMDFLWRLFPNATILHIKRDPRGVAVSMSHQSWAPSNLNATIELLIPTYERWLKEKDTLDLSAHSYLEIKLEDLADNQSAIENAIWRICGLSDFSSGVYMKRQRVDWWRKALSVEEAETVTRRLKPYIVAMGYDVK